MEIDDEEYQLVASLANEIHRSNPPPPSTATTVTSSPSPPPPTAFTAFTTALPPTTTTASATAFTATTTSIHTTSTTNNNKTNNTPSLSEKLSLVQQWLKQTFQQEKASTLGLLTTTTTGTTGTTSNNNSEEVFDFEQNERNINLLYDLYQLNMRQQRSCQLKARLLQSQVQALNQKTEQLHQVLSQCKLLVLTLHPSSNQTSHQQISSSSTSHHQNYHHVNNHNMNTPSSSSSSFNSSILSTTTTSSLSSTSLLGQSLLLLSGSSNNNNMNMTLVQNSPNHNHHHHHNQAQYGNSSNSGSANSANSGGGGGGGSYEVIRALSELGAMLNLKDTKLSTFLISINELLDDIDAIRHERTEVQESNVEVSNKIMSMIEQVQKLKRINEQLQYEILRHEQRREIESKQTNIQYLHRKLVEYEGEIGKLRQKLESVVLDSMDGGEQSNSGAVDVKGGVENELMRIRQSTLVQLAEELRAIKAKIEPKYQKLQTYHDLPPDLQAVKLKITEARNEIFKLDSQFQRNAQNMWIE